MNIKDFSSSKISCIYSLVFPNGKRYVGKTKNLGSRVKLYEDYGGSTEVNKAIEEFGGLDNMELEVLQEVKCRDEVDLELCLGILEIKYIRELGTVYPNGYNVSLGGELLGIPIECITTDKEVIKSLTKGHKGVVVYDLNGDFVKEYPSIARMAYDQGVNEELLRPIINTKKVYGNKWYLRFKRYDYCPQHIEVDLPKTKERVVYKDVIVERVKYKDVIVRREVEKFVERKVIQKPRILRYDMNGKFCGEYENLREACKSFTNSSSGISCGFYRKGYILFKKGNDNYPLEIEPYHILNKKIIGDYYRPANELPDKACKLKEGKSVCNSGGRKYININNTFKVEQYDLLGNLINTFDSVRDASHETGINYANIWACVKGVTKKAAGFKWKKAE